MKVRRGEVVLVDFPYSDNTGSKVRPALVVQADTFNQRLDDTILALITGSRHRSIGAVTQVVIDITTAEGQQTGLRFNSVIQCENLLTYDQALILRVLGRLSATVWNRLTRVSRLPWACYKGAEALCNGRSPEEERRKVRRVPAFHTRAAPNYALHLTASSVRSCLAPASSSR